MQLCLGLTLTAIAILTIGIDGMTEFETSTPEPKYRLCGKRLITAVGQVCNHCYHQGNGRENGRSKRGLFPWVATDGDVKRTNNPYHKVSSEGGVVDRCCFNGCSLADLRDYCCEPTQSQSPANPDK